MNVLGLIFTIIILAVLGWVIFINIKGMVKDAKEKKLKKSEKQEKDVDSDVDKN